MRTAELLLAGEGDVATSRSLEARHDGHPTNGCRPDVVPRPRGAGEPGAGPRSPGCWSSWPAI